MMNGYYGHMYQYGYGPITEPLFWPFFIIPMIFFAICFFVWIALVVWTLMDVLKHKPPHMLAWVFVILFGKVVGPIGYYFIVMKDRQKHHKE